MKIKQFYILSLVMFLFLACTEHEETAIYPQNISFVHADGTIIAANECIDPNAKYAIQIQTNFVDLKRPFRVDYSVNGVMFSMTFTDKATMINPITLSNGNNVAQIIGTDHKATLKYIDQGDFELVE